MKNSIFSIYTLLIFLLVIGVQSCSDNEVENPPNPNEEELITTLQLEFTDTMTNEVVVFEFADPDGDGGDPPTRTDSIELKSNLVYSLLLRFLDESKNPAENITEEIEEEAEEHLVCFTVSGGTTVEVVDEDKNGLPIGINSIVKTADAEDGMFTVVLKHQPDVKDGNCSPGETDIEVSFQYKVED